MTLEDKLSEFFTDNSSRFYYGDEATKGAFNAAQSHIDNLYDTKEELGVDADGEDFLSDYYVAGILDHVIDALSSMHDVDVEDNAFFVELKAIVDSHNKKAAA